MSFFSRLLRRSFSTTTTTTTTAPPNPTLTLRSVSDDLYKEKNLKRLVEKFKKSSDFERFRTKTGIYKDTVRRLANAKRFRWIEEILEHQKKYNDISKEGYNARLISLYGKAGMFDNAQKVFDEMPDLNCKQTVLSFNALLAACVKSKKYDMLDELFKSLPAKLEIEPDLVSYNTMVKAYCEMGSFDLAISMLDEMKKKGVKPDLITFNTLLNGLYTKSRFDDGEKLWDSMLKEGYEPDVRSYNARLEGLAKETKTKEVVHLIEEMRANSIKPDVFSFNAVIKGFVNEENLEEAKIWYDEMEKNDCKMDKATFITLVPFVCEKGDLDFTLKLCKESFTTRRLVDQKLLQAVIDSLVKESKIKEAKELVELGKTNRYCRYKLKLPSEN